MNTIYVVFETRSCYTRSIGGYYSQLVGVYSNVKDANKCAKECVARFDGKSDYKVTNDPDDGCDFWRAEHSGGSWQEFQVTEIALNDKWWE